MTGRLQGAMIQPDTVTATQIAADAVGSSEIAANAVGSSEVADGAIGTADLADNAVTTAKVADNAITAAKIAPAARSVFTAEYVSPEQVITSAGTLTLTHGLGQTPKLLRVTIICKTAEGNYAVNDEVEWGIQGDSGNNRGVVLVPSPTTIFVRYSDPASVFAIPTKTAGTILGLTNGNWRMIVRAWA